MSYMAPSTRVISSALRVAGLKQRGADKDFSVRKETRRGEVVYTYVVIYSSRGLEMARQNAGFIEGVTRADGHPFFVRPVGNGVSIMDFETKV